MNPSSNDIGDPRLWEERAVDEAGAEAARIGGYAGDEYLDPAQRPLLEAGEGVAEGFELAEEDLIEAAETGEGWDPILQAFPPEPKPGSTKAPDNRHERREWKSPTSKI